MAPFSNHRLQFRKERGVALLIVLMLILGLLILGQAAMLSLDQIALRSGTYRRQETGSYCAEEGLNLARAWLLKALNGATQINPLVLQELLADPADPTNDATGMQNPGKDLCQVALVAGPPARGRIERALPNRSHLAGRIQVSDQSDRRHRRAAAEHRSLPRHQQRVLFAC